MPTGRLRNAAATGTAWVGCIVSAIFAPDACDARIAAEGPDDSGAARVVDCGAPAALHKLCYPPNATARASSVRGKRQMPTLWVEVVASYEVPSSAKPVQGALTGNHLVPTTPEARSLRSGLNAVWLTCAAAAGANTAITHEESIATVARCSMLRTQASLASPEQHIEWTGWELPRGILRPGLPARRCNVCKRDHLATPAASCFTQGAQVRTWIAGYLPRDRPGRRRSARIGIRGYPGWTPRLALANRPLERIELSA